MKKNKVIKEDQPFDPSNVKTSKLKDEVFNEDLFQAITTESAALNEFYSRKFGVLPATIIMLIAEAGVGKSSIAIEILCQIKRLHPDLDLLYISSEMTRIDLNPFKERFPTFADIDILYLGDYIGKRPDHTLEYSLAQGWDIVVLDSFEDVIDKCRPEAGVTKNVLESWLINLLIKHSEGKNIQSKNTAFIVIQHVTKEGKYKGSTNIKHNTTGMLELYKDKNNPDSKYMVFSKNRRGLVDVKLYFEYGEKGEVIIDDTRFFREKESKLKMKLDKKIMQDESLKFDSLLQKIDGEISRIELDPDQEENEDND